MNTIRTTTCSIAVALVLAHSTMASTTILYDENEPETLSQQGWPLLFSPLRDHSVAEHSVFGGTLLDTTDPQSERGGYFSEDPILGVLRLANMPPLNANLGYSIRFSVQVQVESHAEGVAGDNNQDGLADRAGFSIITVSQPQQAIELGFWTDRVWAQADARNGLEHLFTQAEAVEIDTTVPKDYSLLVTETDYQLLDSQGVQLLTGPLRDYSPFQGSLDPYETPNFLFFGDNTTRAESVVQLGSIHIASHDFDSDGQLTAADVDLWDSTSRVELPEGETVDPQFDLNYDGRLSRADRDLWLDHVAHISFGDANFDGVFNSTDVTSVFQFGEYQDGIDGNSTWARGDWNGDGDFNSKDVILALQTGTYVNRALPVPECIGGLGWLGAAVAWGSRRTRRLAQ